MTKQEKDALTPLMQQYHNIKTEYSDSILFFRLGDFYEMFGDDALKASPVLEVVLTKRQTVPMCGVPFHSASGYISKLIKKGFKVAICEQTEDPSKAKGIVKREVIRLITPGTLVEDNLLDNRKNNYLMAIYAHKNPKTAEQSFGIAYIDISTGEFYITELTGADAVQTTKNEISRINASEYILPAGLKDSTLIKNLALGTDAINFSDDWNFDPGNSQEVLKKTFNVTALKSFGIDSYTRALCASSAIIKYIQSTQKHNMPPLRPPKYYAPNDFMLLDDTAIQNLELVENLSTKKRENSLLEIIDHTKSAMGSRLIRRYLLHPLTNTQEIISRQDAVAFFINEGVMRRTLSELLKSACDLERIVSRLSSGMTSPRELVSLKDTLNLVQELKDILKHPQTVIDTSPCIINSIINDLLDLSVISQQITHCIADNPPADISKGGFIREGYHSELDDLRKIARRGKEYLAELEQKEKNRTGITSLKIGYTGVFGYYLEVTKSYMHLVPQDYIRKQTLVNAERFITQELKEYEEKVLTAEEKSVKIEQTLFGELKNRILEHANSIHLIASAIARLDVFISFAKISQENNYCRPAINNGYIIDIKEGRHPVLEKMHFMKAFVPNDTLLDGNDNQIIIFTGPNMAGKSTYLRQVALITLLAQTGSYVPASSAEIGILDRIFTRMGASDNLSAGESTFMVEMRETANILHNATPRSLLILDEVGRGTSTFDGISIAWSVIEYLSGLRHTDKNISDQQGPKVLFATHYFELTELAGQMPGVKNYNVSVREWQDEVVFIHKVVEGPSDKAYGIHVAKLAGLPKKLIERARGILSELEGKSQLKTLDNKEDNSYNQLNLFAGKHPLQEDLENTDTDNLTPIEALKLISQWKKRYEK
ncbi:MAG: DNA mismatch repair protein MutS [Elusimicrobia bacterium RIFOXYA2_FULL_39_19]|nr:MAG: DNA mismatch repair protein MutS [Elusimicrobia bacterium RIFOXYA2_FULL_39_19]